MYASLNQALDWGFTSVFYSVLICFGAILDNKSVRYEHHHHVALCGHEYNLWPLKQILGLNSSLF